MPRARGDVPSHSIAKARLNSAKSLAPRTRGCTATFTFRKLSVKLRNLAPRTRGCTGEYAIRPDLNLCALAPRTRGCTVLLGLRSNWRLDETLPRARGDVPGSGCHTQIGYSGPCPAHAGMYRLLQRCRRYVAFTDPCPAHAGMYRGSCPNATSLAASREPCPAHAGMYLDLADQDLHECQQSLAPRTRGCTDDLHGPTTDRAPALPRARGDVPLTRSTSRYSKLLPCPAHAGMYRKSSGPATRPSAVVLAPRTRGCTVNAD